MSNIEEENKSKEESEKNININLQLNNLEEYNFTDENQKLDEKEINNDFQNIIKNQKSINFVENAPKSENEINNSLNSNNLNTNNNLDEEEENNNIINNDIEDGDIENDDMNLEQESLNKTNNDNYSNNGDEELPLITLNFISECQCCKKSFDNNVYKPYLLKCGHFFCIKCIKDYFVDKNGIKCPSDGLIAKSLDELTFLHNLIPKQKVQSDENKNTFKKKDIKTNISENEKNNSKNTENENSFINYNYYNNNYCQIHKDQKLSHIICDSNELICVYCAFENFKNNPKREIKELSTQISEFTNNINTIISLNQNEVLNLHNALKKIKSNKESEEKAINEFFENLNDYIKEKQNKLIDKVNELFNNNTKKLGDKLEEVTENIEKSEKIKKLIESFCEKEEKNENNIKDNYNEILSKYLLFQQKIKINKGNLILDEYKFEHLDEEQISKYCQNLGDIILLNKKNNNSDNNEIKLFKDNFNKELSHHKINNYIFGDNNIAVATMMIAVIVPIYNILAVFALETFRGGKFTLLPILKGVFKNPMILGAITGAILLILGVEVPKPVLKPIGQISAATTPVALIILGASFKLGSTHEHRKQLFGAIFSRLILVPAIILSTAAFLFNFRGIEFVTLIAIFASPCAVVSFAMAQQMGGDADLAGNCVVFTSALSCFTMFCWILLFKMLGVF